MGLHACLKLLLNISNLVQIHSNNPGSNFGQQQDVVTFIVLKLLAKVSDGN